MLCPMSWSRGTAGHVAGAAVDVADEPGGRIEDDHGLDHRVEDGAREIVGSDGRRTWAIDRTVACRGAGSRSGQKSARRLVHIDPFDRSVARAHDRCAQSSTAADKPAALERCLRLQTSRKPAGSSGETGILPTQVNDTPRREGRPECTSRLMASRPFARTGSRSGSRCSARWPTSLLKYPAAARPGRRSSDPAIAPIGGSSSTAR